MAEYRIKKMESFIQQEISEIIRKDIKDPRISPLELTITGVKLSKDIRYATIYFSILGGEKTQGPIIEGLKSARGFIQNKLGKLIRARHIPELRFKLDDSLKRGDKIIQKLKTLFPENQSEKDIIQQV